MWNMLVEPNDDNAWERVHQMRKEAEKAIAIPFDLIVAMGNPLRYDYFPWTREECSNL
ncbi:MAG: hypothetical protein SVM79_04345 [Chloroflexota bacterium]|nr:hypothetical protein [Chloroflexota bacterium]